MTLTVVDIATCRANFEALSTQEKGQWILNWFQSHSSFSEDGHFDTKFLVGSVTVCLTSWLAVLGISKSTFYNIRKKFQRGVIEVGSSGPLKGKMSCESLCAVAWLREFSANYAEKLPNEIKLNLPPCLTKKYVYELYLEQASNPVSKSHFYKLWKRELPFVTIPKRSRFSKCDKCTLIKEHLSTCRDKSQREKLIKMREKHLRQQNEERKKYYKHISKAKNNPEKYLSIIVDAMDQNKTYLPHFLYNGKYLSNMWKLRLNLMGVIIHGIGIYGFFDFFQWSHGSNLTISILIHCLLMLETLPDTLYLQMDNCPGQNKNRFILGFLCWLVEIGIFKKIKISFLMVGHTHEDIDQVFSRFSSLLSRRSVLTLPKLMTSFEKCYTPTPTGIRTDKVFNVSEALNLENISGHSKPHVFKIIKENSKATIYWKKWSTDPIWQKCDGNLLKDPNLTFQTIRPSLEDLDFEKLEKDVRGSFSYFKKEEDKQWWEAFFAEDTADYESEDEEIFPRLWVKKRKEPLANNEEEDLDISDTEDAIPPVIIGKRKSIKDNNSILPGSMALMDVPKYAGEWPQIGKVVSVDGTCNTFNIHWYAGSKSSSWKACRRAVQGGKGRREDWVESVSINYFIMSFSLTPSGNIPRNVKEVIDSYHD
ncbi:uncharacterized protein LOC133183984 [Saccostrea echinata]|uniref:uncharacterized protein LOC133183984 n=1 Tax=Saccostrea echinata TaxID=191078 RepID=UPI002A821EB2|nr:uncharacterized protein LOC133183984 [Saccostrea echinata]